MKQIGMVGVAAVTLLAAGCSATGEGTTADWGSNSWVNAASIGNGQWMITCTNAASACTRRASQICQGDFNTQSLDRNSSRVGGGNQYGFGYGERVEYQLIMSCGGSGAGQPSGPSKPSGD